MNPTLRRIDEWRADRYERRRAQYSRTLPAWHNGRSRRTLVAVTVVLLIAMWVSAAATYWTFWAMIGVLVSTVAALAGMSLVKICSEDVTDAPRGALDEFELREKDAARSFGFLVFWTAGFVPYLALILLAEKPAHYPGAIAYTGAFLVVAALMSGALSPVLLAAWTKRDGPHGDPYLADPSSG